MHNVAVHADTDRKTSVAAIAAGLATSSYLDGSTLSVLSSEQVAVVRPGSSGTWARFTVKLHDPYASGPANHSTQIDACYRLDYDYYGLAHTKHVNC